MNRTGCCDITSPLMADNDSLTGVGASKPVFAPVSPPDPPADKSLAARFRAFQGSKGSTQRVADAMFVALIAGLAVVAVGSRNWLAALLWAGACSSVGWALGFVFGIPRTLSATTPPDTGERNQGDTAGPARRTATNTNLEQISDWLTKIIVGVTLVQLGPTVGFLDNCARVIAESLGGNEQKSFALALMLYFSITGFLGSYLLTRLYLQPAFNEE